MQTAREAAVILATREDEPTSVRVVQRAFEAGRAQAQLVPEPATQDPATTSPRVRRAGRRATLQAAIREDERQVALLRERARGTPAARREAVEKELTTVLNRLELDRLRLELLSSLEQSDVTPGSGEADLTQEIQALQDSVPELNASPAAAPKPAAAAGAPPSPPPSTGTWSVVNRLLALQRARASLGQLTAGTTLLAHDVDAQSETARTAVRELSRRLRDQVAAPGDGAPVPAAPVDRQADFRHELTRLKALGAVLVPLRAESALLRRFENDIRLWQRTVDRETRRGAQDLVLGLAGVAIGLGVIAIGAIVWRIAVERYVQDGYRRRLLLRARKVAAGVAFALQNVILSMAGYFSMMSPNGIRVGDRVSLQGPFGYVHGEVIEIGLVRIRLRELTPDTIEPTRRTVVSPNSVAFTGSFLKHPPAQAKAA